MYLHRVEQIQDLLVEMVERKEFCTEGPQHQHQLESFGPEKMAGWTQ